MSCEIHISLSLYFSQLHEAFESQRSVTIIFLVDMLWLTAVDTCGWQLTWTVGRLPVSTRDPIR